MNYSDTIPHSMRDKDFSNEEVFGLLRAWRNAQLAASDWTQLSDSNANKSAWATYRQDLRDLPVQNEDPKLILFPEPPD